MRRRKGGGGGLKTGIFRYKPIVDTILSIHLNPFSPIITIEIPFAVLHTFGNLVNER